LTAPNLAQAAAPDVSGVPEQVAPWKAVLLAGDRPGGDPLARHFAVSSKSLVPIAGKPMLGYVLDTLVAHPRIGEVLVLAQDPEALFRHPALIRYDHDPRVRLVRSGSGIAASLAAILRDSTWPVLVTTADHVLLDSAMLDWFLGHSDHCDVAVGVADRNVAAAEALDAGRTWLHFSDADVTGANLFAFNNSRVLVGLEYWKHLESHRKKPWRMARELGPWLMLRLIFRRLSLDEGFAAIGCRLGLKARAVKIPYARAGVDVDKYADHVLVEGLLARQGR
jgi:GTP:adenosylcobinamide-phosphate guanylyltransferase